MFRSFRFYSIISHFIERVSDNFGDEAAALALPVHLHLHPGHVLGLAQGESGLGLQLHLPGLEIGAGGALEEQLALQWENSLQLYSSNRLKISSRICFLDQNFYSFISHFIERVSDNQGRERP